MALAEAAPALPAPVLLSAPAALSTDIVEALMPTALEAVSRVSAPAPLAVAVASLLHLP